MAFTGIGDAIRMILCRCWNRCVYILESRRPRGDDSVHLELTVLDGLLGPHLQIHVLGESSIFCVYGEAVP